MSGVRRWGATVLTMAAVAALVLFVTGWGSAAAAQLLSVFVTNTSSDPVPVQAVGTVPVHEQGTANVNVTNTTAVPVQETNTDANGNIKVHEEGTAKVNITNSSLSVAPVTPITSGGGITTVSATTSGQTSLGATETATAFTFHVSSSVDEFGFYDHGSPVALYPGPFVLGNGLPGPAEVTLALTRPIEFDAILCDSTASLQECTVSWVGDSP